MGIGYLSISEFVSKSQNYTRYRIKLSELFDKNGPQFRMHTKLSNLEAIYVNGNIQRFFQYKI